MLVACGVSGRFQRLPPQAQRGGGRRRVSPRHAPARPRPRRPPRHQRARLRRLDGNPNSTRTQTRTRTPAPAPALTLTRPFTWPVAAATWRRLHCSSAAVHGQNAPARSRAAAAPFSHSSLKPTRLLRAGLSRPERRVAQDRALRGGLRRALRGWDPRGGPSRLGCRRRGCSMACALVSAA